MFAHWLLTHPEVLAGAEQRLQTLWSGGNSVRKESGATTPRLLTSTARPRAPRSGAICWMLE